MSTSCPPSPSNKKEYISDIGKILVKQNGKKDFYKPAEVKKAHRESKWYDTLDFSCWAMGFFSSHTDFDIYHKEFGEVCDYAEMRTEMLGGLSEAEVSDWTEISDIDVDASWLDFGDAFEDMFEGIGEFVAGIFEGLG
jgi:hypothetical protein